MTQIKALQNGIDFDVAQALWEDPERLEIPARETDELRYLVIGVIGNKSLVGGGDLSRPVYSSDLCQTLKKRRGETL